MRFLLLFLLPFMGTAQCDSAWLGNSYLGFPSFFSLFNSGKCISQPMGDTTLCVKYAQRPNSMQRVFFSYSSPTGQPAFVLSTSVYDRWCNYLGNGPDIPAGTDTMTICYEIQAELIDNFCPYAIILNALAVEWCGIECNADKGMLELGWKTCSNSNTDRFEVIVSTDAVNWIKVAAMRPKSINNSGLSEYKVQFPYQNPGVNYVAVREFDLNGDVSVSDICSFVCPTVLNSNQYIDLSGRSGGGQGSVNYMWYIQHRN